MSTHIYCFLPSREILVLWGIFLYWPPVDNTYKFNTYKAKVSTSWTSRCQKSSALVISLFLFRRKFAFAVYSRSKLNVFPAGLPLRAVEKSKTFLKTKHCWQSFNLKSLQVLIIIWHGAQVFVDEEKCNLIKFRSHRQPNVKRFGTEWFFLRYWCTYGYCLNLNFCFS